MDFIILQKMISCLSTTSRVCADLNVVRAVVRHVTVQRKSFEEQLARHAWLHTHAIAKQYFLFTQFHSLLGFESYVVGVPRIRACDARSFISLIATINVQFAFLWLSKRSKYLRSDRYIYSGVMGPVFPLWMLLRMHV